MVRKQCCCVPGCRDSNSVRHRIPSSKRIYEIFLQRIANPKLLNLNPQAVRDNYKVCERHFINECKNSGSSQLKIYSVPSLHLPVFHEVGTIENSFLYPPDVIAKLQVQRTCGEKAAVPVDCSSKEEIAGVAHSLHLQPHSPDVELGSNNFSVRQNIFVRTYSSRCSTNKMTFSDGCSSKEQTGRVADEFPLQQHSPDKELLSSGADTGDDKNHLGLKTPRKKFKGNTDRRSFLIYVGLTRSRDLTPKASVLYSKATKLKKFINRLQKKVKSYRARLHLAEKFSATDCFHNLVNKVDKVTLNFIRSQVANQKLKARGRWFTCEDKIFVLSLLKATPKGHKFLSNFFALPSRRTLVDLLGKIPFQPGINQPIMSHLETVVSRLNDSDKHCILLFDEMKLQPHIQYNEKADMLEGFQDFGDGGRFPKFADHVLVFMIRGLRSKWKQPIAYYFVESTTKTPVLVKCIKEVCHQILLCGLKLVATVCDQAVTNVAAINNMMNDTHAECLRNGIEYHSHTFKVDGAEIVAIFDPPHLLKGVRNNLLTKNLKFKWKKGCQVASWRHLELFYALDNSQQDGTRTCPRLTDEHVKPERIRKMKVSSCAQVFSQRVSSVMKMLAVWGKEDCMLPKEAGDTADLFLFMDMLFDSVNGSSLKPRNGKLLRCAISSNSQHIEFWNEAIKVLRTFEFVNCSQKSSRPPSIKNWEHTLLGMKLIWKNLQKKKKGFKFLSLRALNQDPLENFFGCVRSHGVRNTMPSCSSFIASFKTLLVNNFVSPQSVGSNCMKDDTLGSLDNLRVFLGDKVSQDDQTVGTVTSLYGYPILGINESEPHSTDTDSNSLEASTRVYINGYIARQVMKKIGDCNECRNILFSNVPIENSEVIHYRAYTPKTLRYPNTFFSHTCVIALRCISKYLPEICHMPHLKEILSTHMLFEIDATLFTCKKHELCKYMIDLVVQLFVHSWCKSVNRILNGRVTYNKDSSDKIKKLASQKYRKMEKILG